MDIARPDRAREKQTRRLIYGGVWVDTVKRGPMLRQVRGLGCERPRRSTRN